MALLLRGSTYHLRKRVPLRYRPVEVREHVAVSLHTDSQRLAVRKADEIWAQLIDGWEMALRGDNGGAQARYEAAKHIAAQRGFSFIPAPALANAPLEDIVKRALAVPANRDGSANQRIGDALLGGVKEPAIQIEKALEVFWEQEADSRPNPQVA
jgi:hypothetical protein